MSQYADLVDMCRKIPKDYGLSEEQAVHIFMDIMGAIEWDILDDDSLEGDWQAREKKKAMKDLFNRR